MGDEGRGVIIPDPLCYSVGREVMGIAYFRFVNTTGRGSMRVRQQLQGDGAQKTRAAVRQIARLSILQPPSLPRAPRGQIPQ